MICESPTWLKIFFFSSTLNDNFIFRVSFFGCEDETKSKKDFGSLQIAARLPNFIAQRDGRNSNFKFIPPRVKFMMEVRKKSLRLEMTLIYLWNLKSLKSLEKFSPWRRPSKWKKIENSSEEGEIWSHQEHKIFRFY